MIFFLFSIQKFLLPRPYFQYIFFALPLIISCKIIVKCMQQQFILSVQASITWKCRNYKIKSTKIFKQDS